MGGSWRKGLKGEGPAINVDLHFHRSNVRVRFNQAYDALGITNKDRISLRQADEVVKLVYSDAPRLRNAARKYLKGK